MSDLISRKALLEDIKNQYSLSYGEILIDPRDIYDMVDNQKVAIKEEKIEKANKEIRILAQLLEAKTELQEQALGRTGASKRMCLAEIKGIDRALEIVKKEIVEEWLKKSTKTNTW